MSQPHSRVGITGILIGFDRGMLTGVEPGIAQWAIAVGLFLMMTVPPIAVDGVDRRVLQSVFGRVPIIGKRLQYR